MPPGQQPQFPPLTQVTTRDLRIALAAHLGSPNTTLVLKRNTPIAVLLPLYLQPCPTTAELKKARTRTLRRVRLLFDSLIHDNAH